jgi:hypothetical protein
LLFIDQVCICTDLKLGLGGVRYHFGEHLRVRRAKVVDEGGLNFELKGAYLSCLGWPAHNHGLQIQTVVAVACLL